MKISAKRLFALYIFLLGLFLYIVLFKLLDIQILSGDSYKTMAEAQYELKESNGELKYRLLDCNGKELLSYKKEYKIVIEPQIYRRFYKVMEKETLRALEAALKQYNGNFNLPAESYSQEEDRYYYDVDSQTYNKILAISNLKGVYGYVYDKVDRYNTYEIENMITSTSKSSTGEPKSLKSLEYAIYQKTKNNTSSLLSFDKSINGGITPKERKSNPEDLDVMLTLDYKVQSAIREVLKDKKYEKYPQIGVALMEGSTGKLRGFALKDGRQPNVLIGAGRDIPYPPGSIFKIVVAETAYEKGLIKPEDIFYCDGKIPLTCSHVHGNISFQDALSKSCNVTFAKAGNAIGENEFIDKAVVEGIYDKVLNLDAEIQGFYEQGYTNLLSIGQKMYITPLEALRLMSPVINGGVSVKPSILEGYVNEKGDKVYVPSKEAVRVISTDTAEQIKTELIQAVEEGTGTSAKILGVEVGGKTGTAERIEENKQYNDGWFLGFFKKGEKYYSMVVFIPGLENKQMAGTYVAPVFKEVVQKIIPLL